MKDIFALSGRILVTGGTRGIGRAISLRFARAGASVTANFVRDRRAADELKAIADTEGLRIQLCRADLTSNEGLEQIEKAIDSQSEPFRGLVHCAATGVHRSLPELTLRHFDWTFSLNVRAFFEVTRRLLSRFTEPSSILAVSSMGGTHALPYYSLVGSSKGALEALARHLAVELAPRRIRVNIVVPGTVETDVWKVLPNGPERVTTAIERTPIHRLVSAEEIAWTAQFLFSEAASGIVGQAVVVDGGAGIVG